MSTDPNQETVTITKSEYDSMMQDVKWMRCYEAAGVDNWEGIDHAIDIYNERYPGEND